MSKKNFMHGIGINEIKSVVKNSRSFAEVGRHFGYTRSISGQTKRLIQNILDENGIEYSHFTGNGKPIRSLETRKCPVCKIEFEVFAYEKKVTCSHSCSNTHFRTGKRNGNWKDKSYRKKCFRVHEKKCIICEEKNLVDVHHYNEDRTDNREENLVPLCPTHHRYWHSKFRKLIEDDVNSYVENFKKTGCSP